MRSTQHENIRNENVQDIFLRNATLTLLDVLNRNVIIDLKRNDEIEKHEIPFFYNFGGDEGFMKDFFLELPTDCKYPNFAEGNYERMPRGVVTLNSFAIRAGDLTNKFVRGTFTQEERDINGQKKMKAYSSRLFTLPMSLKYGVKIESDNINKTFKILEKIFDFYYKNHVRYFQFRGTRIPCQLTFPDQADFQKSYNFSYTDNQIVTIQLNLDMETYFPSFDDHSTFYKGNTIHQFNLREKQTDSGSPISDSWIDIDNASQE
jgi:hypothetical protein